MNKKILAMLLIITAFIIVNTTKFGNKQGKSESRNILSLNLKFVADIPMEGNTDRWDYQTINYTNNRLYLSHLGSSMVTVFDLRSQKVIKNIPNIPNPYGILVVPELNTAYVSAGGTNKIGVIDEKTLTVTKYIQAGETPDGIAYDPTSKKLFVSNENGGSVTVIDARTNGRIKDIPVGGAVGNTHYDMVSKFVYSVSGDENTLVEIDPATNAVTKKYPLPCPHPHGFYIEDTTHYAFITCQGNATMIVYDLDTKKILRTETVGASPDVLAYDPGFHKLYVSSESGVIAVFNVQINKVTKLGQAFVADKAHTVSVDKNSHKVYLPLENVSGKPVLRIMQAYIDTEPLDTEEPAKENTSPSPTPDVADNTAIDSATSKLSSALQLQNADQLNALLIKDVILSPQNGTIEATGKESVTKWLNDHWSTSLKYSSRNYVNHFGYWELTTTGWSNVPGSIVYFHFFRYDQKEQRQAFLGDWLAYAVLHD